MLCVGAVSAQQALWSASKVVSPQINDDNSVTFRLAAPEAQSVVVVCDYTAADVKPIGPGKMVRGEGGVWEFTTPPLKSELYSYNFIVDGVKVCDPHGSVKRCWYDSPTLGNSRRMTIYTPAGYEQGKEKYPVLYLLHGAGGDEEAWMTLGRTSQILDNLIAQGKCRPMIVVMTNGNAWQQAAPGESAAGMTPPGMKFDRTKKSFEDSFGDVMAYVEDNYRVIRKKEARAVAGLSMGGGHSFNISRMYPDTFDYVGLFSAAVRGVEDPDVAESLVRQRDNGLKLYWIACGNTDFLSGYRPLLFVYSERNLLHADEALGGLDTVGRGLDLDSALMFGALYDERELPAEEVHVRLLERLERCGVAVGHGAERACAAHLEAYLARVRRKRIAILVHDAHVYVAQILTVGGDPASVGRKFYAVGLAGRADALLGGGTALRIVRR